MLEDMVTSQKECQCLSCCQKDRSYRSDRMPEYLFTSHARSDARHNTLSIYLEKSKSICQIEVRMPGQGSKIISVES